MRTENLSRPVSFWRLREDKSAFFTKEGPEDRSHLKKIVVLDSAYGSRVWRDKQIKRQGKGEGFLTTVEQILNTNGLHEVPASSKKHKINVQRFFNLTEGASRGRQL